MGQLLAQGKHFQAHGCNASGNRELSTSDVEGQAGENQVYDPASYQIPGIRVLLQLAAVHQGSIQAFPGKQTPRALRPDRLPCADVHAPEITAHRRDKNEGHPELRATLIFNVVLTVRLYALAV